MEGGGGKRSGSRNVFEPSTTVRAQLNTLNTFVWILLLKYAVVVF